MIVFVFFLKTNLEYPPSFFQLYFLQSTCSHIPLSHVPLHSVASKKLRNHSNGNIKPTVSIKSNAFFFFTLPFLLHVILLSKNRLVCYLATDLFSPSTGHFWVSDFCVSDTVFVTAVCSTVSYANISKVL